MVSGSRMGGVRGHRWYDFSRQGCTPSGTGSGASEVAEAWVWYVLEAAITEELKQRLVVYCYNEIAAPEDEVASLVQGISNSNPFHGGISGLCCVGEARAYQGDTPTFLAAEQDTGWALALFSKQQEPDPVLAPVCGKAGWAVLVEDLNTDPDALADVLFGGGEASSLVHSNGVVGLSRARKGCMALVIAKVYATWFTSPNHALMSVMLVGVGKSVIDCVYLSAGLT